MSGTHASQRPRAKRCVWKRLGGESVPDSEGCLDRFAGGLEIEQGAVTFEVLHVAAVGEGHIGHEVHEALDYSKYRFRGIVLDHTSGAGDVYEQCRETTARGECSPGQVAVCETWQE